MYSLDLAWFMEVGRCGYMGDSAIVCTSISGLVIVRSMASYYVCCRNYMYKTHVMLP